MPKRRVKERRKRAHEFKRLAQVHGGRGRFVARKPMSDLPASKEVENVLPTIKGDR